MADPRPQRFATERQEPGGKQRRLRGRLSAYRAARQGQARRRIPPEAVPSFFTLLNLFSGFLSITQIHAGRFEQACWLVVLAAFFDVLDGMMARLTKSHSVFGTELDSLADIVSFGIAPSFLVYAFGLEAFGPLGLITASLPAVCGAVRLARFNVTFDGVKKDHFTGVPIPTQAIVLCALVLNFNDAAWFSRYSTSNLSLLIPIVFVLSFLMVTTIPFDAAPKPTPAYIRANPKRAVAYLIGFLLIIVFQERGLLVSFAIYVAVNIVRAIYKITQDILNAPLEDAEGMPEEKRL